MADVSQVAFLGLGAMGAPMARNVAADGFDLTVWNRTRETAERFAEEADATVADTPANAADGADAVVVMVTDGDALHDVLTGADGALAGLQEGAFVVNTSTVSEDQTQSAAALTADAGGRFVDAPVSGTVGPAEQGTLTALAGGSPEELDAVESLLSAWSETIVRCGGVGQGTNAKLSVNLLLGGMMESFAEALTLAAANDLGVDALLEAVESGGLSAPLFSVKGDAVADGDFTPAFPVELLKKDLDLALDSAGESGVPMPATAATREAATATEALGHDGEDMAALVRHLEEIAGVESRR